MIFFFIFFYFQFCYASISDFKRENISFLKEKSFFSRSYGFSKKGKTAKKLVVIYLHGTFGLREILSITRPIKSLQFLFSLRNAKKKEVWLRFQDQRWLNDKNYFSCIMNEKKGLFFVHNNETFLFNHFSYDASCDILFLKKYFLAYHQCLTKEKDSTGFDFYVYNWSGSPYFLDRRRESARFYKIIKSIYDSYRDDNIEPVFCFIGYSHGGNLVLDLPLDFIQNNSFVIDYLVLLGTPILDLTKKNIYVKNKKKKYFFKHVVNLYTPTDKIQVIDFTSPNKGYFFGIKHNFAFSKRRLPLTKKHKKRKKVYNISCLYSCYEKKIFNGDFYFSDLSSGLIQLNHYNLAYFRNFYKKIIGKRKHKNFYFPPVLFLVPSILSSILDGIIDDKIETHIAFQFLRNTIYIFEKEYNYCSLKGKFLLADLYSNYLPFVKK